MDPLIEYLMTDQDVKVELTIYFENLCCVQNYHLLHADGAFNECYPITMLSPCFCYVALKVKFIIETYLKNHF